MPPSDRILVIWNPAAGPDTGDRNRKVLVEGLDEKDYELREWQKGSDPRDWFRDISGDTYGLVMAAGGDGTVTAVVDALLWNDFPLPVAIFPTGSANAIAAELGYPDSLEDVIPWVFRQETVSFDAGFLRERDRYFIMSVSSGLHADIVKDTSPSSKRIFGWLAYVFSAIPEILRRKWHRVRLLMDGKELTCRSNAVVVLNLASTIPGTDALPGSIDPSDGRMNVLVNRRGSFSELLKVILGSLVGKRYRLQRLESLKAGNIRIEAEPPMSLQMDGETIGSTPVEIEVEPGAVRIRGVPEAAAEEG
ncbi:MAG: diacylglycerol kinase family protein [Candidatus Aegiribacteria sp.]